MWTNFFTRILVDFMSQNFGPNWTNISDKISGNILKTSKPIVLPTLCTNFELMSLFFGQEFIPFWANIG